MNPQPKPVKKTKRRLHVVRRRMSERRTTRVRDLDFMAWVRTLPCCLRDPDHCDGPIEADHAGRRGLGQKCSDDETIPLCRQHHRWRTDYSGAFYGFNKDSMRRWCDNMIFRTQALRASFLQRKLGIEDIPR